MRLSNASLTAPVLFWVRKFRTLNKGWRLPPEQKTRSECLPEPERCCLPCWRLAFHLYVVRASRRDHLLQQLKAKGIDVGIHYPIPVHRQPVYLKLGYGDVSLPITEKTAAEVLSLPMYPELRREQIEYVAQAVREAAP